jgi:hypothetical protein
MHRILHGLIIAACSGFFLYQAYLNIDTYFKYPTSKTNSITTLSRAGLPRIEVCLRNGFDLDFLQTQGYEDLTEYVTGWSNGSLIGWAGNGSMTTDQIIANATVWKDGDDIFSRTKVYGYNYKWGPVNMKEVWLRYPAGKCFALDEGDLKLRPDKNFYVLLEFKDVNNSLVSVSITDPKTVSWNPNFFSYSGDNIVKNIGKNDANTQHLTAELLKAEVVKSDNCAKCSKICAKFRLLKAKLVKQALFL